MKVSIYAPIGGIMAVLIESTPGKGRPPVVLMGIARENLKEEVAKVVASMRRPRGSEQSNL